MIEKILITLFYYVFIAIIVRFLGKREIAQLGVLDLVIFLLIADVCAIGIENKDYTLTFAIISIAVLEKILSFLLLKVSLLRKIVDGKRTILIKNGKILYKNLKKETYTLDDLLSQLRINDITNINDVKLGILETDGSLSICKTNEDILLPVIQGGKIINENLIYFGKDKEWIIQRIENLEDVFCAFIVNDELQLVEKTSEKE